MTLAEAGGIAWLGDTKADDLDAWLQTSRGTKTQPITWLFEPETFTPLSRSCGSDTQSIVSDHLGTPVLLTTSDGQREWSANISAYGELRDIEGTRWTCPFRWPGQYEDAETGLYYNRFRYYDAESGQYASQDPIRVAGGVALHGYVRDPLVASDPYGLSESLDGCGGTLAQDTLVNRIGGSDTAMLRLKPNERALNPPGISVLLGNSPQEAATQMKKAFKNATKMHALAETVGSSTVGQVREAGFDVIPDPSKNFPNHGRLVHPSGIDGFSDDNLDKLSRVFSNHQGLK